MTGVDLFPTVLREAGVPLPRDRIIDGNDLWPTLRGSESLPERPVYYYQADKLLAVRVGRWKAHRRHGVYGGFIADWPIAPLVPKGPWLFDLVRDPDESYDVGATHPSELERLLGVMQDFEDELAAAPRGFDD